MAALASITYDPTTVGSQAIASLAALAKINPGSDQLRLTFTSPAGPLDGSGKVSVLARIRCVTGGTGTTSMILLGILDGATSRGRLAPMTGRTSASGTYNQVRESMFVVSGLNPSTSYTWDPAVAVQTAQASSVIRWGGPQSDADLTANNAHGPIEFSIFPCDNLLAGKLYDPATAVQLSLTSINKASLTELDTTNLRHTIITPASGRVLVRMQTLMTGVTGASAQVFLGVREGAFVARGAGGSFLTQNATAAANDHTLLSTSFIISGLTPGSSHTYDASYAIETALASSLLSYGGPDNATGNNAWGGFAYEIWAA